MTRQAALLALVAVLAAAMGLWLSMRLSTPEPTSLTGSPETMVGQHRPSFTIGSATGERVSADAFDGKVMLLNFWATWCAPCVEEMPLLEELHQEFSEQGLRIIGIALDDVQSARDFADSLDISYTILLGTIDVMALTRAYGNVSGQLPYSVLVGRDGQISWVHLGVVKRKDLVRRIESLL